MAIEKMFLFKFIIFILSSAMFLFQLSISVNNLMNPNIADTTQIISIEQISLPLITICPRNQLNNSKITALGYSISEHRSPMTALFLGLKRENGSSRMTWGNDENLTFESLLEEMLTYKTDDYAGLHVDANMQDGFKFDQYTHGLKRKFYIGFWGFCWELEKYDVTRALTIRSVPPRQFAVYITERSLMTHYSINLNSQNQLLSDHINRKWYEVSITQVSNMDPRIENVCFDFEEKEFSDCIDVQVQTLVKPIMGCNPPWLSSTDKCENITFVPDHKETENLIIQKLSPFIFKEDHSFEKNCFKPCTTTIFHNREKSSDTYPHALKISFNKDVSYTSKFLTYDLSSFIIDIGRNCQIDNILLIWYNM